MKRLVSNKRGEVSYGPKLQNTEPSSDSENDYDDGGSGGDDLHSHTVATAQEDNGDPIPKGKIVEVTVKDGELMYLAALQGDWVAAEVLLQRDPNLAFDYVTEEGDRALHVATAMKREGFVEKLIGRMSDEELALLDGHGNTACCYAAISGDVKIARLIIGNRPNLATARDVEMATPLHKAALRGNKKVLSLLMGHAKGEDLSRKEWFDLLLVAIRGRMSDLAIDIMGKNGSIATMANEEEGTALHQLARVNVYSIKLVKKVWNEMLKMEKASLVELMKKPVHIVHEAAKTGQAWIITMLTRSFPKLIWETDDNGYTIFHLAVMYRESDVFHLVYQVEPMLGSRTTWQDKKGNNMLHLAAAKSASVTGRRLSPAYQMKWELEWFKAVKEIVPPSCLMMRNGEGLTPGELLYRTHRKLLKESIVSMTNRADSLMLIATILLTVVFAAAFTVPGGYSSQTGEPLLGKKKWFKAFVVFEVISFVLSVFSIMTFQSIMASSFTLGEFLYMLPSQLTGGFQILLMSLMAAFLAFMSSISLFNLGNMKGLVWSGIVIVCGYGTLYWFSAEFVNSKNPLRAVKNRHRPKNYILFNKKSS